MSDTHDPPVPGPSSTPSDAPLESAPSQPADRTDLLSKARTFLQQPQVQREDVAAKRKFLAEKGLTETEIDMALREPQARPVVPPPSYPQPPPSNLPVLLIGMARLLSWLVGGAAALAFIYRRILLPRILESFTARKRIFSHQISLLQKLNESLRALKTIQSENASVLPKPDPYTYAEPPELAACATLDTLVSAAKVSAQTAELAQLDAVSLLRCGIADFAAGAVGRNPNTEELFTMLESKLPWLVSDEGRGFENRLWETLSTCPLFVSAPIPSPDVVPPTSIQGEEILYWSYNKPEPAAPTELAESLSRLAASVPKSSLDKRSPMQHALQTASDLTGFISAQMYSHYVPIGTRLGSGVSLGPAEEEVRKEIRTLKGLVLNRRTFMSSPVPPS
ncbi:hypothetical protein MKEN_00110400 [Mycena kentingensis (nom. inval.)]|nr:hypothetical protein MKEN_00110400 [Mycena kentingensis (nom. inval.)]